MILYVLIFVILVPVFTILGYWLNFLLKIQSGFRTYSDFTLAFVVGIFTSQAVYSLVATRGVSINIIVLFASMLMYRQAPKVMGRGTFSLVPSIAMVLFVSVLVLKNFSFFVEGMPTEIADDMHFTSTISYYINQTGQENEFKELNALFPDYHGTTPYHYTELWLNSMIAEVFNINYSLCLSFVVFPLFYFAVFLSILALAELVFEQVGTKELLLVTAFLFFISMLPDLDFFFNSTWPFLKGLKNIPLWYNIRFAPYLAFCSFFFIFYYKHQKQLAYFSLILLGLIQFTPMPAIFSGIFIWCLYFWIFKGNKNDKKFLINIVLISISFLVFKFITGNAEIQREGTSLTSLVFEVQNVTESLGTRFNILAKEFIYVLLRFHMLLVLFGILLVNKIILQLRPFILGLIISGLGLGGYMILYTIPDSNQLFENFFYAFLIIGLIFLTFKIWDTKKYLWKVVISCFIIAGIVQSASPKQMENEYSEKYRMSVKSYLNELADREIVGASFRKTYLTEFSAKVTIYTLGSRYLSLLHNGASTICLSDYDIPVQNDHLMQKRYKSGYEIGVFYRYVEEQKKIGDFESISQCQFDFITQNRLKYAFFEDGYEIPRELNQLIRIKVVDEFSGESFVIFDI